MHITRHRIEAQVSCNRKRASGHTRDLRHRNKHRDTYNQWIYSRSIIPLKRRIPRDLNFSHSLAAIRTSGVIAESRRRKYEKRLTATAIQLRLAAARRRQRSRRPVDNTTDGRRRSLDSRWAVGLVGAVSKVPDARPNQVVSPSRTERPRESRPGIAIGARRQRARRRAERSGDASERARARDHVALDRATTTTGRRVINRAIIIATPAARIPATAASSEHAGGAGRRAPSDYRGGSYEELSGGSSPPPSPPTPLRVSQCESGRRRRARKMASGDNVDVIEVVETTSFPGSASQPAVDHLRPDQSTAEEDCECAPTSAGELAFPSRRLPLPLPLPPSLPPDAVRYPRSSAVTLTYNGDQECALYRCRSSLENEICFRNLFVLVPTSLIGSFARAWIDAIEERAADLVASRDIWQLPIMGVTRPRKRETRWNPCRRLARNVWSPVKAHSGVQVGMILPRAPTCETIDRPLTVFPLPRCNL